MTILQKDYETKYIGGSSGSAGTPAIPAISGRVYSDRVYERQPTDYMKLGYVDPFTGEVWTAQYGFVMVPVVHIYHTPPTPEIPAVPAVPAQPGQITSAVITRWDASAKSIAPINQGEFVEINVGAGSQGVFLAIGGGGMDRQRIGAFSNSVIIDLNGVRVMERGEVHNLQLVNRQAPGIRIRIHRQVDNSIVYVVIDNKSTQVYTSAYRPAGTNLFVYTNMYRSGDSIISAEIDTGVVSYGSL